jgi:hypothetical protein
MDDERRKRKNAQRRERYHNDTEYREKIRTDQRERYADDEQFREKKIAYQQERWANDDEYRERQRKKKSARMRERYAHDSEFRARHEACRLKREYGITVHEFNELLRRQNYACGICERRFDRKPHVDHCHLTQWVRGLLCRKCNLGLGHFDDNPAFLVKAARYMARWLLHVLQTLNRKENDMTTNDDPGDSKASRMMRKAILHELHQPFGLDPPEPADNLQAIARALVTKAVSHDVSAIKEILDRIDGKTPSAPANNDLQQLVNLSWKLPESLSKMSPSTMRPSKNRKEKSKSTTSRAPSSSPSTDEPSGSPAS